MRIFEFHNNKYIQIIFLSLFQPNKPHAIFTFVVKFILHNNLEPENVKNKFSLSRGGFTVMLTKLKLQSPSLVRDPSKVLEGALAMS